MYTFLCVSVCVCESVWARAFVSKHETVCDSLHTCIQISKCRAFNSQCIPTRYRTHMRKSKKSIYLYTCVYMSILFGVFCSCCNRNQFTRENNGLPKRRTVQKEERRHTHTHTYIFMRKKERPKTTATTMPSIRLDSVQYSGNVL